MKLPIAEVKSTIFAHPEFTAFNQAATKIFVDWKQASTPQLKGFAKNGHPKQLIEGLSEDLLARFKPTPLVNAYDVYQHLMDYWAETMQDDCYLIADAGWQAGAQPREVVKIKDANGKLVWPKEPFDYTKGIYLDNELRDHNLFQAICRTNRLDGDDKDYGHIVDYKELFEKVQDSIAVYTSDELDIDDGGDDGNVTVKNWLKEGKAQLDAAREALRYLCEPVPDLLHGNEQRVYGDSAYASQKALIGSRAPKARDFTNQRVRRGGEIDEAERSRNHNKSKVRARVEHVFAVVKRLWGFAKVRYRGLAKNATRSFVVLGLANIYLARQRLVA